MADVFQNTNRARLLHRTAPTCWLEVRPRAACTRYGWLIPAGRWKSTVTWTQTEEGGWYVAVKAGLYERLFSNLSTYTVSLNIALEELVV